MPLDVVLGAQWGDEGKGKLSTILSTGAHYCARFQGGPNAGHTTYVGSKRIELRMLPAGVVTAEKGIVGDGTVIDLRTLMDEIDELGQLDSTIGCRVLISTRAHVISAEHIADDAKSLSKAIGTTGRGVGPCYSAKASRSGYRIMDILSKVGRRRLPAQDRGVSEEFVDRLGSQCIDTGELLRTALARSERVVAEGGQGASLDLDQGDYPYVTSSNTTIGGVLTGLGVSHKGIDSVWLTASAYLTKLGSGAFPTKVAGPVQRHLQEFGDEYDRTRGEVRSVGWLDLGQIRRAVAINGADFLAVSKLDVLSGLKELELHDSEGRQPIRLQGWANRLSGVKKMSALPAEAVAYLTAIELGSSVPIGVVSTGAGIDDRVVYSKRVQQRLSS